MLSHLETIYTAYQTNKICMFRFIKFLLKLTIQWRKKKENYKNCGNF